MIKNDVTAVYLIKCIINNRLYIGGCKGFRTRKISHRTELKNNIHHSYKLQKDYNKYGEENFVFEILEECNYEILREREQYWMDLLQPYYNILKKSKGGCIIKHTEKAIEKMRKIRQEQSGIPVYQFSLKGEFIQRFNCISDAGRSLGLTNCSHISSCCNKKRSNAYGYIWSYTETVDRRKFRYVLIEQYDLEGNFIKEWKGFAQIAKYYNLSKYKVANFIKGDINTKVDILKEYKWKMS